MDNMPRLEAIVRRLPEAERVDIEAWGGEPTFRVRGKNFVFSDQEAHGISVKLTKEEAAAVVATDRGAEPTGYGLGKHGWVTSRFATGDEAPLDLVREWIDESFRAVAPKSVVAQFEAAEAGTPVAKKRKRK